jgi:hypothetical protein
MVYVDDLLIVSETPQNIINRLSEDYKCQLKDMGTPPRFLRATIGQRQINGEDYWYISAEGYIEKTLKAVEVRFGKIDTLYKYKVDTPAPTIFPTEIDDSDFLVKNETTLYHSYIGILHWSIELGRIDLAHFGSTMAKFSVAP